MQPQNQGYSHQNPPGYNGALPPMGNKGFQNQGKANFTPMMQNPPGMPPRASFNQAAPGVNPQSGETIDSWFFFCCCSRPRTIKEFISFHASAQANFETVLLILSILSLASSSEQPLSSIIAAVVFALLLAASTYYSCKFKSQVNNWEYSRGRLDPDLAKCSNTISLVVMIIESISLTIVSLLFIGIGIISLFIDPEGDGFAALIRVLGILVGIIGIIIMIIALLFIGQWINCCKFRNKCLPFIRQMNGETPNPSAGNRNSNYA